MMLGGSICKDNLLYACQQSCISYRQVDDFQRGFTAGRLCLIEMQDLVYVFDVFI